MKTEKFIKFFGVKHYGSVPKLTEELRKATRDREYDAIFLERRETRKNLNKRAEAFLKNPSVMDFSSNLSNNWTFIYSN